MPRAKQFCEKEVLNKAMKLFWKKGFHATSVQDLVSTLGISRASLYDTFGDKKNLFNSAFENYVTQSVSFINDFFEKQQSIKEGFYLLLNTVVSQSIEDKEHKGCFVVNTITEMTPCDKELEKKLFKSRKKIKKVFQRLIEVAQEKGEICKKKDAKSIASALYILYSGLQVASKVRPKEKELKDTIAISLSILN